MYCDEAVTDPQATPLHSPLNAIHSDALCLKSATFLLWWVSAPAAESPFVCVGYPLVVAPSGNCAQLDDAIAIFIQLHFFCFACPCILVSAQLEKSEKSFR